MLAALMGAARRSEKPTGSKPDQAVRIERIRGVLHEIVAEGDAGL